MCARTGRHFFERTKNSNSKPPGGGGESGQVRSVAVESVGGSRRFSQWRRVDPPDLSRGTERGNRNLPQRRRRVAASATPRPPRGHGRALSIISSRLGVPLILELCSQLAHWFLPACALAWKCPVVAGSDGLGSSFVTVPVRDPCGMPQLRGSMRVEFGRSRGAACNTILLVSPNYGFGGNPGPWRTEPP